jgi:hypothetical protein
MDIIVSRIEVPTLFYYFITVAFTASLLCRKRHNRIVVKRDLIAFLADHIDTMNKIRTASVTFIAKEFFALIGNCRQGKQQSIYAYTPK